MNTVLNPLLVMCSALVATVLGNEVSSLWPVLQEAIPIFRYLPETIAYVALSLAFLLIFWILIVPEWLDETLAEPGIAQPNNF